MVVVWWWWCGVVNTSDTWLRLTIADNILCDLIMSQHSLCCLHLTLTLKSYCLINPARTSPVPYGCYFPSFFLLRIYRAWPGPTFTSASISRHHWATLTDGRVSNWNLINDYFQHYNICCTLLSVIHDIQPSFEHQSQGCQLAYPFSRMFSAILVQPSLVNREVADQTNNNVRMETRSSQFIMQNICL